MVALEHVVNGQVTLVTTASFTPAPPLTMSFGAWGCLLTAWYDGDDKISTCAYSPNYYGGVALGGLYPKFDNLKIGLDANSDGDLNDVGDEVLVSETFGSEDKILDTPLCASCKNRGAIASFARSGESRTGNL
ncbi:MAG: hypothetical protein JSU63_18030, partial [Phycisphaerales bacterium]